jgi:hypothetical protein
MGKRHSGKVLVRGPYDADMQLARSRDALRQATQAVEGLRAVKDDSEQFRDRFPFVLAAVQRVGSIIDAETKGHRTPEFGEFWKQTQDDPLFRFMREVRNAEFKRGESRQAAHHQVTLTDVGFAYDSFQVTQGGRVIAEAGTDPSPPWIQPSAKSPSAHTINWYFSGGGLYDGQEVLSLVNRYLNWLRGDILPTAERLTMDA